MIPDLPGQKFWLSRLWFKCLHALPTPELQGALVAISATRFTSEHEARLEDFTRDIHHQPIVITEEQSTVVEVLKVLAFAASDAGSGAVVGSTTLAAGIIGGAIGIPAGVLMGLCVGLALGVHHVYTRG